MTADLPKLIVGCGKLLAGGLVHGELVRVHCGDGTQMKAFCGVCQHNLDAVKKNAAAHQALVKEFVSISKVSYQEGARDAVLELAGLTLEDLEVEKNE